MLPRPVALLALLALHAPVAFAQADDFQFAAQLLFEGQPASVVDPGDQLVLLVSVTVPERANTSWRFDLNVTGAASGELRSRPDPVPDNPLLFEVVRNVTVPEDATDQLVIAYSVVVSSRNNTAPNAALVEEATFADSFTVAVRTPPVPPSGRTPIALIAGAAIITLVALSVVVLSKRRPRQVKTAPRSRALQEMAEERRAKKGKSAKVAPEESRQHPQLAILQARAGDVRRLIELARERVGRGELTEHQFKMIREKKEAELQRIEQEMARYREG